MKIGILTWFFADNYGARAHTYALRQTIISMGHECEFVNYIPGNAFLVNIRGNINCEKPQKHMFLTARCFLRCLKFTRDRGLNIHGKRVHNASELDELHYDMIVIGSDAIFNIHHPLFNALYYGSGLKTTAFCTYAPSCEYMNEDEFISAELKSGLYNATALSARDTVTKNIIQKVSNKSVQIVLDPTLLYNFESIAKMPKDKNYIFVYTFSDWDQFAPTIKEYAQKHLLEIISVGRHCKWADHSYDSASFKKWLGFFTNADLVFTDSFHGTVFAIKNKKPLIIASRSDKQAKIKDFLCQCGLENQEFITENDNVEEYLRKNKIDYTVVEKELKIKKKVSIKYLKDAIEA